MLPPPWPRCRFLSVSRTHRDPLPIPPGAAGSGPGSPLGSPRLPLPGPAPCAVFPRLPPRCCQPNKSPLGAFWFLLFCFSPLPFKSHGNTSGGCSSAATGIAPCTAAPPPDPKSLGGSPGHVHPWGRSAQHRAVLSSSAFPNSSVPWELSHRRVGDPGAPAAAAGAALVGFCAGFCFLL